ncbi:MAG: DUF4192 domain-containing protein [Cellulomonadaceae bacterium]|nr:DUF4192 domain-containing protein [Cellulomonadaceae bacterium]
MKNTSHHPYAELPSHQASGGHGSPGSSDAPPGSSDHPIAIKSSHELLSAVPYLLGYTPTSALAVVCIREGGSLGVVAALSFAEIAVSDASADDAAPSDGAGSDDPPSPAVAQVRDVIVNAARTDQARYAFVVAYEDTDTLSPTAVAMVNAVGEGLTGIDVECQSWHIGPERFRALDCQDDGCCPSRGWSNALLAATRCTTQFVVAGVAPAASRDEALAIAPVPETRRVLGARAASRMATEYHKAVDEGQVEAWRKRLFDEWLKVVRVDPHSDTLSPARYGRLAQALHDVTLRDEVLTWCFPEVEGLSDMDKLLTPGSVSPPNHAELRRYLSVMEAIAEHVPVRRRAPALTLCAVLAWWAGRGGRANERLSEARAVDPSYTLAALWSQVMAAGVPPSWVSQG